MSTKIKAPFLNLFKKEKDKKNQEVIKLEVPANSQIVEISENGSINNSPESLESVLKKCNINKKIWDVDKFSVKELSNGNFLWTINFKKGKGNIDFEALKNDLKQLSKVEPLKEYHHKNGELLFEFFCPDLHFGKMAWSEEVGHNYDMKIAASYLRKAADETIQHASKFNITRILFPIGNDFLQTDSPKNMTTAGTPQDVDSRHHKMFREGYKLLIEIIERLKIIAPVDVISVPGNHDQSCSLYMAEVLDCYYHNDPNVTVDARAILRKYYKWGKNLIGFTHGDKEKINDLSVIMATEAKKEWAETSYRFWHLGHIHTKRLYLDEKCGVLMKSFPSLSGTDAWHHSKGYTGNIKGTTSCILDKEKGLIAELNYNV